MLSTVLMNLRLAIRSLRREVWVAVVAMASLAIGIGANATVFSLVQAVEFPRLIYPDASRLVFLESANSPGRLIGMPVSAPDAEDIARSSRSIGTLSLTADQTSIMGDGAARRRVTGRRVTAPFFDVMAVAPARGRVLSATDLPGALVMSDRLWRADFNQDETIVGRALRLDGGMVTVVGVMPPRFDADADFWTPLGSAAGFARDDRQVSAFARLAPGVSIDEATRELAEVSRRLAEAHGATNEGWSTYPVPLARLHGRDSRGAFLLLQAAVGFLLLIACANIANILLARATRRRHEMALRLSLGATRGRLLGLLLTESVLLSFAGGAAGVALAFWGIRLARAIGGFPDVIEPTPNLFVVAFAFAVSVLTGILCGIVPALRASHASPGLVLAGEGARGGSGDSRGAFRAGLVALQIAGAVVLATGGSLMLQSLLNRQRVDLGFDPRGAVRATLALTGDRYETGAAQEVAVAGMLDNLRGRPDVAAAGAVTWALPTPPGGQLAMATLSRPESPLSPGVGRAVEAVTPGYFDAIGLPLRAGRSFEQADRFGSAPVAIVNEQLARHLWPAGGVVGESLRLGGEPGASVVTVVGVFGGLRRSAMHDAVIARVYVPFAQHPNRSMTVVTRARGDAGTAARDLRAVVAEIDPDLLVEDLRTVEADLAQFVAPLRLLTWLLGGFGVTGLALAALGVFGTMSYTVTQRRRELAVRSALGANRRQLARLVLASGVAVTVAGLIPGVAIAVIASRALAGFLFGVTPADPATMAAVALALGAVSIAACARPAHVAATADPMSILRRD